jgi:LuxR family maltose regulon positive regulatory protein
MHDQLSYVSESVHIALARVLIAQGRADEANELLERLRRSVEAAGRMGELIEILAVQAIAQQTTQRGDPSRTFHTLTQALALAEQQGNIRKLVDEGAPMASLLREAHARGIAPTYVARLLAAFGKDEGRRMKDEATSAPLHPSSFIAHALVEPLSVREQEVLRLIAAGLSNDAIAQKLVVALSTVKKHINNIYTKLGVESRTQALARARELHLL